MMQGGHSLVRHDLGEAGKRRVRESLSAGLRLTAQLSAQFDPEDGLAFTFAPPGSDNTRLLRWDEGGLLAADVGLQHLVNYLQPRLKGPSRLLIAENAMARRTDPALRSIGGGRFFVGDDVYEYVGPSADATAIEDCLRRADAGYSLNGAVVVARRSPQRIEDPSFLEGLAPELLITRGYDGESFVVWERSK